MYPYLNVSVGLGRCAAIVKGGLMMASLYVWEGIRLKIVILHRMDLARVGLHWNEFYRGTRRLQNLVDDDDWI